jgi:hypothetical protein
MTTTANTANTMTDQNTIVAAETPEAIAAYHLLAIRAMLKLERVGMRHSRGTRASILARDVLKDAGKKAPAKLADLAPAYGDHLRELGILAPAPAPVVIHYGTH